MEGKVHIPVCLPGILKEYAKAVLREQPEDIVQWSARYFDDVSRHPSEDQPPSPPQKDLHEAIHERLRVLHQDNQGKSIDPIGFKSIYGEFYGSSRIPLDALRVTWLARGYSSTQLRELLAMGRMFESSVDRDQFCALVCGTIGSTLRQTLCLFLEVTSGVHDPHLQIIPYPKFEKICNFLMKLNSDDANLDQILKQCRHISEGQGGMISRENLMDISIACLDE